MWFKDGQLLTGVDATSRVYTISIAGMTDAGVYQCKASNAYGMDSQQSVVEIFC